MFILAMELFSSLVHSMHESLMASQYITYFYIFIVFLYEIMFIQIKYSIVFFILA